MNDKPSLSQSLARRLTAHASHLLRKKRADWADAIRNELAYVPSGWPALRWSIGCLFASYIERATIMQIGTLKTTRLSRVALTLEMLLCFVQPTGGGLLGLFSNALFGGQPPFGASVAVLLLTTSFVGPLGLFLGFNFIVLEQRSLSKRMTFVLCALAAWTFVGNTLFVLSVASPASQLRAFVLLALFPLLGAAHLVYLANAGRRELRPA